MFKFRIGPAILVLCLAAYAAAGQASPPNLKDLSWLAGNWTGTQDGVEMEEAWLSAKGNTMLGLHRDVRAGRTISFEFLRLRRLLKR